MKNKYVPFWGILSRVQKMHIAFITTMKTEIKKLPKSQIEIDFEITSEEFNKYIDKALEHFKKHVKVDGFRKGNVPKEIVERETGPENLLMEAGDIAVKESYTRFVNENNLEPISEPELHIIKIAKGNPFLFKVKVSLLPELELPDYKKIALQVLSGQATIAVDEQEIQEALNYLQKSRAKFSQIEREVQNGDFVEIEYKNENINKGKEIKDKFIMGQGGFMKDFEDNIIGMKSGEEKEFKSKFPENINNKDLAGKESMFKVKVISVQKMELPEINDEFAKSLGDFSDLEKLKDNLKEGITLEKEDLEKNKRRGEILEKISTEVNFDLPEKMVEYEQVRLFEDMKNQIAQNAQIDFDEYLKSIKKTEAEIKESFKIEAEKRVKNFLVLRQIGKSEKVEVSNEELQEELNNSIKNYTKEQIDKIDINRMKEYTKGVIFNEKIFQLLENLSQ